MRYRTIYRPISDRFLSMWSVCLTCCTSACIPVVPAWVDVCRQWSLQWNLVSPWDVYTVNVLAFPSVCAANWQSQRTARQHINMQSNEATESPALKGNHALQKLKSLLSSVLLTWKTLSQSWHHCHCSASEITLCYIRPDVFINKWVQYYISVYQAQTAGMIAKNQKIMR